MKSRQSLILAATAAIFLAGSMPAFAAGTFEDFMNQGVQYFKNGNYIQAIESFKSAQALNNIPDIPYNIARSYQNLGDCDNALKYFREYALTSAENADKVKSYIEELNSKCGASTKKGSIQMRCIPDSTLVYIDSSDLVQCNGIYELSAGEHSLKFVSDGYVEENRTVDIMENSRKSLVIDMVAVNGGHASDVTGTDSSEESYAGPIGVAAEGAPFSKLFWSGVGSAGGGLLFSIIGVSMAATSHRKISYNKKDFYERSTSKLVGGCVMAGIGLAAMTAGVTLLVVDRIKIKKGEYATTVVPSISVTPDSASAGVSITF